MQLKSRSGQITCSSVNIISVYMCMCVLHSSMFSVSVSFSDRSSFMLIKASDSCSHSSATVVERELLFPVSYNKNPRLHLSPVRTVYLFMNQLLRSTRWNVMIGETQLIHSSLKLGDQFLSHLIIWTQIVKLGWCFLKEQEIYTERAKTLWGVLVKIFLECGCKNNPKLQWFKQIQKFISLLHSRIPVVISSELRYSKV